MFATLTAAALRYRSVSRSHPGRRRTVNEDRVLERPEAGLWAVADGMGGHQGGAAAAERLIDAIAGVEHGASGYSCLTDIQSQVERLNAALFAEGEATGRSGSTLVALLAHEGHYACLWAGDSRAYRLRDGTLAPITQDHSIVQRLVDEGALSEDGRRAHPGAHVITRAVGAAATIELDQRFARISAGDIFLLCSDGLTACLDDVELAEALKGDDLVEAADTLLAAALARQAPDNVSLVLVRAEPV